MKMDESKEAMLGEIINKHGKARLVCRAYLMSRFHCITHNSFVCIHGR